MPNATEKPENGGIQAVNDTSNETIKVQAEIEAGLDVKIEDRNNIPDPGKLEGTGVNVGPVEVPRERWNRVYHSAKELERMRERGVTVENFLEMQKKIEDLEKKGGVSPDVLQEMQAHNARLASALEGFTKVTQQTTIDKTKSAKQSELDELKSQLTQAASAFDSEKVVEIAKKVAAKEAELENIQVAPVNDDFEEASKAFVESAKWFQQDSIMTAAAEALDIQLKTDPAWKGKPIKDRFMHVKDEIERRFHYTPENTTPEQTPQAEQKAPPADNLAVEGGGHAPVQNDNNTIKLTVAQVQIAKGLGITPEKYAKQLILMEARNGR